MSIDRLTEAPGLRVQCLENVQMPSVPSIETHMMQQQKMKKTSTSVNEVPTSLSEYAVDCTVEDKGNGRSRCYIVVWYKYGRENNTLERAKNIPKTIHHTVPQASEPEKQANAQTNTQKKRVPNRSSNIHYASASVMNSMDSAADSENLEKTHSEEATCPVRRRSHVKVPLASSAVRAMKQSVILSVTHTKVDCLG